MTLEEAVLIVVNSIHDRDGGTAPAKIGPAVRELRFTQLLVAFQLCALDGEKLK